MNRYWESIWLSISSQFDSNILQLLGIPGWILVPPVTQHFRSKWLHFFFQYKRRRQLGRPRGSLARINTPLQVLTKPFANQLLLTQVLWEHKGWWVRPRASSYWPICQGLDCCKQGTCTERKNGVILTWNVESLVELKFNPGFTIKGRE